MKTKMKSLWLLPLAATLLLSACSTLPLPTSSQLPGAVQAGAHGRLRINLEGLHTMASPDLLAQISKVELTLRIPNAGHAQDALILPSQLQQPLELSFEELPIGSGEIVTTLYGADGAVLKTLKTPFQIRGGETSQLQLILQLGGSSASDLILMINPSYNTSVSSFWSKEPPFEAPVYWLDSREYVLSFRLIRPGQLDMPIVYRTYQDYGFLTNTSSAPQHADYLGEFEMPGYPRVRKLAFTNLFPTPQGERVITVERCYAPGMGMIQETLFDGENEIARLVLDSLVVAPATVPPGMGE